MTRPSRVQVLTAEAVAVWVVPASNDQSQTRHIRQEFSEAMARDSTGGVLGMLTQVKDPVRLLRRIAVTVAGT